MENKILNNVSEALRNMKFSLDNYKETNNHNKIIHLRNFITTGRSVTFIIQNLKSDVGREKFDAWYTPWQTKMSADKILKTFKDLRNEIEKQGKLDTSIAIKIEHFNSNDIKSLLENSPPFSTSFFIGDQKGGSGWEIDYGKDVTEKIYVELPSEVKISIDFEVDNLIALNENMTTTEMMKYYFDYLTSIYVDARATFI